MAEEEGEVLAISLKNGSIKIKKQNGEEKWLKATSKTKQYLKELKKGDKIKFREEKDKLAYLNKLSEPQPQNNNHNQPQPQNNNNHNNDDNTQLRIKSVELAIQFIASKHTISVTDTEDYLIKVADKIYNFIKQQPQQQQQPQQPQQTTLTQQQQKEVKEDGKN
jgi:hypothetical protein